MAEKASDEAAAPPRPSSASTSTSHDDVVHEKEAAAAAAAHHHHHHHGAAEDVVSDSDSDSDSGSSASGEPGPYQAAAGPAGDGDPLSSAEKGAGASSGDLRRLQSRQSQRSRRSQSQRSHRSHRSHRSQASGVLASALSRIASNASWHHESLPPPPLPLMDLDKGIVGWDSADDPAMPLNFPSRRKWFIISLLTAMAFMTPLASSILSPAINYMDADFHNTSETMGSLAVSIYLLGYAVGPLFLAGMSELFGRHIVLTCSNVFFCGWIIGCARAPNLDAMIVMRFLAGVGGSACMSLGGACIGDLFHVEDRGLALSAWAIGPLVGPTVGPLAGAWIAQTIGWRWDFWVVLIPGVLSTVLLAVFSSETSHRVLILRKVERLSRELGRNDLRSCYDDPDQPMASIAVQLRQGLIRPLKLLVQSPALLSISILIAFAYGVLYLLFNTIPMVFQDGYGWSIGFTGLVYIPLGLGYVVGLVLFATMSDKTVVRLTQKNNGVYEPEMRLIDCVYFACCLPITFFWYGWSADKQVHWIVPILGLFPYGFALMGIWQPAQAFVIDAFDIYSASAIAAFTVLRSVVAAFLPLAGPRMYASLGVGWGNSLLGFICVGLIPVPLLIYRYGGMLRKKYPLKL